MRVGNGGGKEGWGRKGKERWGKKRVGEKRVGESKCQIDNYQHIISHSSILCSRNRGDISEQSALLAG